MVVREQSVAFDHHDIQAVMGVVEHSRVTPVEQIIEHAPGAFADLRHGHAFGKVLLSVQLAETPQACGGIRQAGTGETPGAHRCTDQRALARHRRQPFAKQGQVQSLNAQGLGTAGGTGQRADIGGAQAVLANACQCPGAGLERQGGELDMDSGHTGLECGRTGGL
ncbi:hypothetical protein D3C84_695430 [compost metagenome]